MVVMGLMAVAVSLLTMLYGTVADALHWRGGRALQSWGTLALTVAMGITGVTPTMVEEVAPGRALMFITQVFLVVLPLVGSLVVLQGMDDGRVA